MAGKRWAPLLDSGNLIYELEMLSLLDIIYRPNNILQGKNSTFHIDDGNAFEAVVKNNAKPLLIAAMAQLIRHRIYTQNITAWSECVPGARNIDDLPSRDAILPPKCEIIPLPLTLERFSSRLKSRERNENRVGQSYPRYIIERNHSFSRTTYHEQWAELPLLRGRSFPLGRGHSLKVRPRLQYKH